MVYLQKKDRVIAGLIVLLFIGCPIVISYAYANMSGWSTSTEIAYNVSDHMVGADHKIVADGNNGSTYSTTQTYLCDNTTKEVSVASLDLPTVGGTVNYYQTVFYLNTTFLAAHDAASIKVSWYYVGAGNITYMKLYDVTNSRLLQEWATTDIAENGSATVTLQAFQMTSLKTCTRIMLAIKWADTGNFPVDTDYLSQTLQFYESTSLLTQTQLLQGLGGGAGILFLLLGAVISPWWNPGKKKRYRRRNRY